MNVNYTRLLATGALLFSMAALLSLAGDPPSPKPQVQPFTGKVVPLAGLLEKGGFRLDKDAAPYWLALVGDDGKVYPLVKDEGSRMFFLDAGLHNRPMRLTGRLLADTHLLQVSQVHSLVKGELHEVYYWCDVCTIKRFEKMPCECCGAPMEFREERLKK